MPADRAHLIEMKRTYATGFPSVNAPFRFFFARVHHGFHAEGREGGHDKECPPRERVSLPPAPSRSLRKRFDEREERRRFRHELARWPPRLFGSISRLFPHEVTHERRNNERRTGGHCVQLTHTPVHRDVVSTCVRNANFALAPPCHPRPGAVMWRCASPRFDANRPSFHGPPRSMAPRACTRGVRRRPARRVLR